MNTVVSVASLASASAVAAPSNVTSAISDYDKGDAQLRHLWEEYLTRSKIALQVAQEYKGPRKAYDEACDRLSEDLSWDDHLKACKRLWRKHKVGRTSRAANVAWGALNETVRTIRATESESMFGICVKLFAFESPLFLAGSRPAPEDYQDAMIAALRDIDRVMATKFSDAPAINGWGATDDDPDENS